ncbi:furin-like protease 1, isoforms 1/1-X/2 [Eurosta solidaginis]|uniref:furin-like protease 1, isoforms 1/1-X/2 n=1 Tax=Eurosta solidaginis TaxID=178769 RepID=UPI003530ED7F
MKNDVVRWRSAANAEIGNESKSGKSNLSVSAICKVVAVASKNTREASNESISKESESSCSKECQQLHQPQHKQFQLQKQQQQKYCDSKENSRNAITTNSFLVNTPYSSIQSQNYAINQNATSNKSRRHFEQKQLQQQQQQDKLQAKYVKPRTFIYAKHFNRILLNCVHLNWSVVVLVLILLCSLNVGFVFVPSVSAAIAAHASDGAAAVNEIGNNLTLILSALPYELDYAESGDSGRGDSRGVEHFTHTWAVHIPNGDNNGLVEQVARDHGFINLGKIFDDHYHFSHHKVSKRSLAPSLPHQTRLDGDHRVQWAKQQQAKSRRKRDYIRMRPSRTSSRALSQVDTVPLNDPKWPQMWYLNRGGGLDMNVVPAWQAGITGRGIVVTILDDGLESDHPDIEHNYDPDASYDVNSHDNDPMPHYDMTDSNRHGTRCAGEVAATANNSICAVGIAFGASVGGVRMLDGDVTDAVEARSLSLNPQHIDIYSASWGPDDDGKTVDGPGELAQRAFIEGVTKGRQGKGSIFIWASGNGGRELDNCNCDGYTNSIWTLSISSATEEGHVPWYSEKCSSTLATTYSSGGQSEKQVVTTDLHHSCTVSHTGTSASAPLAAGIAALVLESNTNLTWRDLQHIVVRTAKPANLRDPTWSKNGVGRRISHSFGYGLMDAAAMVKVARNWKTVPEQQRCEINAPHVDKVIPPRSYITLQLTVKHCSSVNYLEHVQAKITLTSQRRGDIQLNLKSPAGTKVTLLTSRIHDVSRSGFNQWPFMSVHTWGESPHGNWQLEIHNEGRYMGHALLREWSLIFYGTTQPIDPNDPISTPRANSAENTTPNSNAASATTNLHQIYSPQYPRISSNNIGSSSNLAASSIVGAINAMSAGGGVKIPIKMPMPLNKSVYTAANGANNPLLNLASGNSKKQQQLYKQQQQPIQPPSYQQISATYGVVLSSQTVVKPSKNGKGKGKSSEKGNGKGYGNGGGAGNKSTSNKKEQSGTTNTKNKFYRISQQQQHQSGNGNGKKNGKSSQQAGRSKAQQSAERLHAFEDKMSRKVIGEITTTPTIISTRTNYAAHNNNNNPNKSSIFSDTSARASLTTKTASKTSTTQLTSYSKLPIKATKQIKESLLPLQTHEKLTVASFADTRIPKLFERYEKIQAIFPEFQPYQGPKEKDTTAAAAATVSKAEKRKLAAAVGISPLDYEAETFRPMLGPAIVGSSESVGGGAGSVSKPSRENIKKSSPSFVPDERIIKKQQLLLAAAGVSGGTQRPIGGVVGVLPNRKGSSSSTADSSDAQITQWDLIFYGTEIPAQPEDVVHISDGLFGNDMAHNDIEYDSNLHERNMQQVGESMANDKTNTSCLKATPDQRCLDCAMPTYFYNGHCYEQCPMHTYSITNDEHKDEEPQTPPNVESANLNDNTISKSSSLTDDDDELQSIDRRRRKSAGVRLYADTSEPQKPLRLRRCEKCDISCQRCYGALNSQCSTCPPGSQLRKIPQTNETFCYIFAERSSGNSRDGFYNAVVQTIESVEHNRGMHATSVTYLSVIMVPALLVIVAIALVSLARHNSMRVAFWKRDGAAVSGGSSVGLADVNYDRVALLTDDNDYDDDDVDDQAVAEVEDGVSIAMRPYRDEFTRSYANDATINIPLEPSIIEAVVEEESDSEDELFDSLYRGRK